MDFFPYSNGAFRLTGRWSTADASAAVTTAPGSYFEFAFSGKLALICFDIEGNRPPFLHLWVRMDEDGEYEVPLDAFLLVKAKEEGNHVVRVVYKGGEEVYSRWYKPLHGKVSVRGFKADAAGVLPNDGRPTIELVGDSITEGVLIDTDYYVGVTPRMPYDVEQWQRPNQDDACATYGWLTAEALGLRPIFMGYGATGTTRAGQGLVPKCAEAYPFNFDGDPVTRPEPNVILINHGANDRGKAPLYAAEYKNLLDIIRAMNPHAVIVCLSAFVGAFRDTLRVLVEDYNKENGTNVYFIDGGCWLPPEPLHPHRDGHETVAKNLTPILGEILKKEKIL